MLGAQFILGVDSFLSFGGGAFLLLGIHFALGFRRFLFLRLAPGFHLGFFLGFDFSAALGVFGRFQLGSGRLLLPIQPTGLGLRLGFGFQAGFGRGVPLGFFHGLAIGSGGDGRRGGRGYNRSDRRRGRHDGPGGGGLLQSAAQGFARGIILTGRRRGGGGEGGRSGGLNDHGLDGHGGLLGLLRRLLFAGDALGFGLGLRLHVLFGAEFGFALGLGIRLGFVVDILALVGETFGFGFALGLDGFSLFARPVSLFGETHFFRFGLGGGLGLHAFLIGFLFLGEPLGLGAALGFNQFFLAGRTFLLFGEAQFFRLRLGGGFGLHALFVRFRFLGEALGLGAAPGFDQFLFAGGALGFFIQAFLFQSGFGFGLGLGGGFGFFARLGGGLGISGGHDTGRGRGGDSRLGRGRGHGGSRLVKRLAQSLRGLLLLFRGE